MATPDLRADRGSAADARSGWLTRRLAAAPPWAFTAYAVAASFSVYFCMYAYRKPFAAASYGDVSLGETGLDLKTALVLGQILGYTVSKYAGIRVCSELNRAHRGAWLLGLVATGELALVLFGLVPPPFQVVAMFCNGVPLGLVWGIVVTFLEGRRTSDVLLAGLSCSFILASGVVKDVGRWLMLERGVAEAWMPAATGAVFAVPFVVSVAALAALPPPSAADEQARVRRVPMDRTRRRAFLRAHWPALLPLLAVYVAFTAYRDFRDNYGVEILRGTGHAVEPGTFAATEVPVALLVLLAIAVLGLVRDSRHGLIATHAIMLTGALVIGAATLALDLGLVGGVGYITLAGVGTYLVYVPYNTVLFDRMVASTGVVGTAVFAIYVADALGYTGSVVLQVYRDLFHGASPRLGFFRAISYGSSGLGVVGLAISAVYFGRRARPSAPGTARQ